MCDKSGKAHKKPSDAAKGFCFWLEASSKRREEAVRSYIDACYGISMYAEQQNQAICHMLCTGCHSTCRLHFTRERNLCRSRTAGNRPDSCGRRGSREKEQEQFEANRPEYENSIRRLMERIQNTLLVDLQPVPEKAGREK